MMYSRTAKFEIVADERFRADPFPITVSTVHVFWANIAVHSFTRWPS